RAGALQAVEHGQQVAVQPQLGARLEDDVTVVDEDDRRRVVLGRLEDAVDPPVEVPRARDDRAIDQEELPLQPVRQRPAYRRLAAAGRPQQQDAALGLQPQLQGQGVVLQGKHDVPFERLDHVADAVQVAEIDLLNLGEIDVAQQVLRAQAVEECLGVQGVPAGQRGADRLQLVDVERGGEAVDAGDVEGGGVTAEQVRQQEGVVVDRQLVESVDPRSVTHDSWLPAAVAQDQLLAGLRHTHDQRGEDHVEHSGARVVAAAIDDVAEDVEVVEQDNVGEGEGLAHPLGEGFRERQRVPRAHRFGEVFHGEEGPAPAVVNLAQERGLAEAGRGLDDEGVAEGQLREQTVEKVLLRRAK